MEPSNRGHASQIKEQQEPGSLEISVTSEKEGIAWKRKVTPIENSTSYLKNLKHDQSMPSKSLIDRKMKKLDNEKTPRKYSLRTNHVAPQEDDAKKESIKILRYYSKGEPLCLNGQAESAKDKNLVICSHLAEARARGVIGTKESKKYSSVSSAKQISEHTQIKTDDELKETTVDGAKKAQESYYFDQNGLGAVLQAAMTHQKDRNCYQKMYYLGSLNHAMTLEMIRSDDNTVIKLNVYDPNDTVRERRIIVPSFDALKDLTLDDFIPEKADIELYFPERPLAGVLTSPEIESEPGSAFTVFKSKPSPALLHLLLRSGTFGSDNSTKDIENSINEIITGDRWTDKDKKELLAAKDQGEGFPGLQVALGQGHTKAVIAFVKTILSSNLSPEDKKELLAAKRQDGIPGLSLALQYGHTETVKAFVEAISSSEKLSLEDKKELLAAKRQDGLPGFLLPLGHPETVQAYIETILSLPSKLLTSEDKKELLAAKKKNDTPGLFLALQNEHTKAAIAFIKVILSSEQMSLEDKKELLAAKRQDGTPALYVALLYGHAKATKAYIKAILSSELMSLKDQKELLAAKNKNGTPGFFLALEGGHTETAIAVIKGVLSSELSLEDKKELLAAKKQNGTPGFLRTLSHEHAETAIGFIEVILSSKLLTSEDKKELLAAKNQDGTPGLFLALQNGYTKAAIAFIKAILSSKLLTLEDKKELLAAKNKNGTPIFLSLLQNGRTKTAAIAFVKAILSSDLLTPEDKKELLTPSLELVVELSGSEKAKPAVDAVKAAIFSSSLSDQIKEDLRCFFL